MDTNLRPSGIEGLGDMAWGTHFCLFYETKDDLLDFFIPFFKAGLEHHEFCLCVASEPLIAKEAERAMRQALPDFEQYLAEGQIEITPHTDWYLKEGWFDEQRVLQGWTEKLEQAVSKGFSGLRFAANILLEKRDWESFARYEGKLEETLRDLRIEGLCAYSLNRYSAANALDVIHHHQFTVARRDGIWQPLEGARLKRAHDEVLRLNAELEQRVMERTAELTFTNERLSAEIVERMRAEKALRASETRLQAAIDAADIGLWDWDLVSGQIIWLGHHEKLFGFAPGEFDGTYPSFEKRVHPEDVEELNRVVQRAREDGSEYLHEYRVIWPDGRIHWIAGQGRFVYNETGRPVRMYGAVLDITERKQAEVAIRSLLQISEKLHATLDIDALLDSLVIEAMKLIDAEIGWSGLRTEEGMVCHTHITRDLQVLPFNYFWPPGVGLPGWVLVHKVPYVMNDAQSDKVIIPEIRERFGVNAAIDTPILDAQGEVIGFFEVNNKKNRAGFSESDVEKLVAVSRIASIALQNAMSYRNLERAEEAIRKSERVLREAESLGHTGSWEQDLATGEIFNTEENLRLFFGDDRSKGTPFDDYAQAVHPDDREFVLRRHEQLLEGGPGDIEFRVVWPDGSVHVLFGRATVVRDESGQAIRIYGTNLDITEHKRAEEEIKHQAARAETLARIAARLNKQLDLDAVIHAVCEEAINTFKVSQATMSLYDKKRDLLVYAGGINIPPEYAAIMEAITRSRFDDFLRTMGPIMVVPDIQSVPDVPNAEFSSHLDVRTVVTAAMLRDQELIGALVIGVNGHVREFDKDELTLLKAISDQAAQAIANAQLLKAANEQHEQLRALSTKLVEVQETERRALTTELHDRIGQNLTGLSINLQNMKALLSPEVAQTLAAKFDDAQALVQDTTRHIRDIMAELRLSELEDYGLAVALETYAERAALRGNLELIADLPERAHSSLPSEVQIAFYRAAQEAINNVLKHADATQLEIILEENDGRVRLIVEDDGKGLEPATAYEKDAKTWGLKIMRERVESIGGKVEMESKLGHGTRVIFVIKRPS